LISRDAASGGIGELNANVGRWAERVNRSLKDAYRQVNYILDVLNSGNVVKDADESVTSSVTLQNDDDLFLPIKANLRYRFEMYLYVNSTGAGGFRQNWTLPSGAVGHCQIIYNSSTYERQKIGAYRGRFYDSGRSSDRVRDSLHRGCRGRND
jgi:hypothetical protein